LHFVTVAIAGNGHILVVDKVNVFDELQR
jgi:hypothetical protein